MIYREPELPPVPYWAVCGSRGSVEAMPQMTLQATDFHGRTVNVAIDALPNVCPFCAHTIGAKLVAASLNHDGQTLTVMVQCARNECLRAFIAFYSVTASTVWRLGENAPRLLVTKTFPECVSKISSSFVRIYGQANAAETHGLDEIAGVGYRRALEFLVKDYVIHQDPSDRAKVEAMELGNVIANKVDDPRVKESAKRAAWLGNDEAHYVRKWPSRDITDLKRLIHLTVNWIDSDETQREMLLSMSKPAGS